MTAVSLFVYVFLQVAVPILIGSLFQKVYKGEGKLLFFWISGQMILWAVFQGITVPFVLGNHRFKHVLYCMGIIVLLLLLFKMVLFIRNREWSGLLSGVGGIRLNVSQEGACRSRIVILQILSVILLVFQLVMTLCCAYEEGDDAFYLALSTDTWDSGMMYAKNPYTGSTTDLDMRHGLAPFPMWITLLAKISGILPITMAQMVLPLTLILMTYSIHYLVGRHLFQGQRESFLLYMVLVEMLVIFGGYSTYSVENFLLVRASQGKAVLCNLILPFLMFLSLRLVRNTQKGKEVHWSYWILHFGVCVAGCLCSTQGGLLICILMSIVGLCIAVMYRKWKYLVLFGTSCLIPVGYMLVYLMQGIA